MVCIVINSCKVHEAAVVINDLIDRSKAKLLPKIIVATFWDEARTSGDYRDCEDELARQAKFKDLVKEHMASLNDSIGEVLFVDSVSRERTGIKELRQQIRSRVEGKTLLTAGSRSKHQASAVFKRKLSACRIRLGELSTRMSVSVSCLEEKIRNTQSGKATDHQVRKEIDAMIHNAKKRLGKYSQSEAMKYLKDAEFKYKTAVKVLRTVDNEEELSEIKEEIEQDVNDNIIPDLQESLRYSYRTTIADEFSREIKAFLGRFPSDRSSSEFIEERIDDSCEDVFEIDGPFEFPEGIVAAVEKEVKSVVGTLMKSITSPQNIMLIIGGILLLTLASLLDSAIIPKAVFTVLQIAGFAAFAMAIFRIVPTYQREREKAFRAILKKRLSGFEKQFTQYLKSNFDVNIFRDKVQKMVYDVERDIQKEVSPHLELSRELISRLEKMRLNVENAREDLEREMQKL